MMSLFSGIDQTSLAHGQHPSCSGAEVSGDSQDAEETSTNCPAYDETCPPAPEQIRIQIEESRAALAEKLEALESRVSETVHAATTSVSEASAAVAESVSTAKVTVAETVDSVQAAVQGALNGIKQTFDISSQHQSHPWRMLAGAIAVGFLADRLVGGSSGTSTVARRQVPKVNHSVEAGEEPWMQQIGTGRPQQAAPLAAPPQDGGLKALITEQFGSEISQLRSLAVGTSLGLVRDVIADSVPVALRPQVRELMDRVTKKLGGQHVNGPIFANDALQ